MKLIVGLGNPGKQYEKTRHNAGWIVLDMLVDKFGYDQVKFENDIHLFFSKINGEKIIFAKPQTFMNNSGIPIRRIMQFYKISNSEVIVIHDEKDFDLGKNQIKLGGSSAGHNGVKSIIQNIGGESFLRYRIGISSPPPNFLIVDWVLSKMSNDDIESLKKGFSSKTDFLWDWTQEEDIKKIMTKYN